MTTFNIFANGTFWGQWEAETAEEAMQKAADEVGTIDVGQEHASTEGLTAEDGKPMTSRNYATPTISVEWATSRETAIPVAVAIHAIADSSRSPEAIWEAPTPAEWDHVTMAVAEYVAHGDYEFDPDGYPWGGETIHVVPA